MNNLHPLSSLIKNIEPSFIDSSLLHYLNFTEQKISDFSLQEIDELKFAISSMSILFSLYSLLQSFSTLNNSHLISAIESDFLKISHQDSQQVVLLKIFYFQHAHLFIPNFDGLTELHFIMDKYLKIFLFKLSIFNT